MCNKMLGEMEAQNVIYAMPFEMQNRNLVQGQRVILNVVLHNSEMNFYKTYMILVTLRAHENSPFISCSL